MDENNQYGDAITKLLLIGVIKKQTKNSITLRI